MTRLWPKMTRADFLPELGDLFEDRKNLFSCFEESRKIGGTRDKQGRVSSAIFRLEKKDDGPFERELNEPV